MIQQLILAFTITALVQGNCPLNNPLVGINTYPLTVNPLLAHTDIHIYSLPIPTQAHTQLAVAINQLTQTLHSSWNLHAQTQDTSSISLTFASATNSWTSISLILLTTHSPNLMTYFHSIDSTQTLPQIYHISLPQPLKNEQSSVAVVFLVGIELKKDSPQKQFQLTLVPFRIVNQQILLSIDCQQLSLLRTINISYLLFNTFNPAFLSFGNMVQIPIIGNRDIPQKKYMDVFRRIPDTPHKLYGLSGLTVNTKADGSPLKFQSQIDINYLLTVTSNKPLTLFYLFIMGSNPSCQHCSSTQSLIFHSNCIDKCPVNSATTIFRGSTLCRYCPSQLNLKVDLSGTKCICLEGYQPDRYKRCIKLQKKVEQIASLEIVSTSQQSQQSKEINSVQQVTGEVQTKGQPQVNSVGKEDQNRQVFIPLSVYQPTSASNKEITKTKTTNEIIPLSQQQKGEEVKQRGIQILVTAGRQDSQVDGESDEEIKKSGQKSTNESLKSNLDPQIDNNEVLQTTQINTEKEVIEDELPLLEPIQQKTQELEQAQSNDTSEMPEKNYTEVDSKDNNTITADRGDTVADKTNQATTKIISQADSSAGNGAISAIQKNTVQTQTVSANSVMKTAVSTTSQPSIVPITVSNPPIITQPAQCLSIPNSVSTGSRCVCKMGFVNISSNCVPLSSLQLLVIDPSKTVKAIPACPSDQSYSQVENKCLCKQGLTLSASNVCVSICPSLQQYDYLLKQCTCISVYARIGGKCALCQTTADITGNEVCYPLPLTKVCRFNYTQSGQFCLACGLIQPKIMSNQICINCNNGFIYNGSQCICPQNNNIVGQNCIKISCGNGNVDQGETCDDGNTNNSDGCSSTCLIQSGYFCRNASQPCSKSLCGDSLINGGQLCDDGNIINGDGCSSVCLVQTSFTCLSVPSKCFPFRTGNLTLKSISVNTNNIFVQLKTPNPITFSTPILSQTFISVNFLSTTIGPTPYCEQTQKKDVFLCLLIYPNGSPTTKQFIEFSYSKEGSTGRLVVEISNLSWVSASTKRRGQRIN